MAGLAIGVLVLVVAGMASIMVVGHRSRRGARRAAVSPAPASIASAGDAALRTDHLEAVAEFAAVAAVVARGSPLARNAPGERHAHRPGGITRRSVAALQPP